MKAAAFGVVRADSVEEVLAALAEHGDEARVMAGGQSLGPLMALRLAAPSVVVDLARVEGLDTLAVTGGPVIRGSTPGDTAAGAGAAVRIGAMVRQRTVEHHTAVRTAAPLLAEAVPFIGHTAIRSQGTVCGSLAHADPAAELPAVAVAAGATMHLRSLTGSRAVAAAEFFTGYYSTAIEDGEILEAVTLPPSPGRTGTAFVEFSRRHGDFALVGVAATVSLDAEGTITAAGLALSGVASTPWPAAAAAAVLLGATPSSGRKPGESVLADGGVLRPEPDAADTSASGRRAGPVTLVGLVGPRPEGGRYTDVVRAAAEAVRAEVDPSGDLHATAAYRRHLAAVLTARALTTALGRAQEVGP